MDKVKCKCECTCDECGAECNDIVYSKSNIPEEKLYTEKAVSELKAENERLKARLRPLEDSYFNGLSSIEIAELAKKSIRITAENRKLEYALQEIKRIIIQEKVTNNKKLRAILDLITKAEEENE